MERDPARGPNARPGYQPGRPRSPNYNGLQAEQATALSDVSVETRVVISIQQLSLKLSVKMTT